MRRVSMPGAPRIVTAMLILAGPSMAQDSNGARALRLRFGQAATQAMADFRLADSVERNLEMQGSILHSSFVTLRLQIEAALNEGRASLAKGEMQSACESIIRAESLTYKFGNKLGVD